MARNWLRLVLAAAIASAVAAPVAIPDAQAQTVSPSVSKKKAAAKKAQEPQQDGDQQGEPKKKRQDPAEAQKTIEGALKHIEAGKTDAAVQALTATLSAGNLPPGLMARALYYRGMGYRQQQKPGQAIADLTQALWIKGGLSETDRSGALKQRSGAYADAGLAEPAPVVASAPSNASLTTGSNAPAASSGGGWNLFSGFGNSFSLFNSGSQSSAQPPPAPASPPPPPATVASVPTAPPAPAPTVSSWSSSTEVRATTIAMAPEPPAPPQVAARPEGKFRIQLGLVRTDGEARAIMLRVRGDLANVFDAREPSVDETVVGNFGSMFRVRVGPYASAGEGNAVCARLKGSGLDCLVVTQ